MERGSNTLEGRASLTTDMQPLPKLLDKGNTQMVNMWNSQPREAEDLINLKRDLNKFLPNRVRDIKRMVAFNHWTGTTDRNGLVQTCMVQRPQ